MVTQIIRGQPVSTAVSSATTVSTSQKVATTPGTPSQHMQPPIVPPHPPRPQQGQVKLTMAQLTQLTQGQVSKCDCGIFTEMIVCLSLHVLLNRHIFYINIQAYSLAS